MSNRYLEKVANRAGDILSSVGRRYKSFKDSGGVWGAAGRKAQALEGDLKGLKQNLSTERTNHFSKATFNLKEPEVPGVNPRIMRWTETEKVPRNWEQAAIHAGNIVKNPLVYGPAGAAAGGATYALTREKKAAFDELVEQGLDPIFAEALV